jgi:hypothetical protein
MPAIDRPPARAIETSPEDRVKWRSHFADIVRPKDSSTVNLTDYGSGISIISNADYVDAGLPDKWTG